MEAIPEGSQEIKMKLIDLQEGGKALSSKNVTRIAKEDIPATIKYVSKISGVPIKDLYPIGSVGKTDTSGDIDLAVDITNHHPQHVHERMLKALGGDDFGKYNDGIKTGNYAVPIQGQKDKLVQVDLMYVKNPKWAQFAYFSAGDRSKYKGAVRNILMSSVAATLDEKGKDVFHYDGDDLIVRVGRGIDMNLGLKRLFQMRSKKKTGEGYVKTHQRVTPEEIRAAYPDLEFEGSNLIIDDPQEVVTVLFGPDIKPSHVDTAEELLELIKRFPKARQDKIFEIARKRFRQHVGKIALPPEATP